MYVVVEFVEAEPSHRASLRNALLFWARTTLERDRGCQRMDVSQDDIDGTTFLIYQVFDSKDAYMRHMEMTEYAEHRILTEPWTKSRRMLAYDLISHGGTA
jgi:autoinducer 2-degrading protein